MTLRPARWAVQIALFIAIVSSIIVVLALIDMIERIGSKDRAILLIVTFFSFAYAFFASGRYLRFIKDGFEIKNRFRKPQFTRWEDIAQIGLASFPCSAGGRLTYTEFVGIKFHDDVACAATKGCRLNRKACGYDMLLAPNYGVSLDRFINILKTSHKTKKRLTKHYRQ